MLGRSAFADPEGLETRTTGQFQKEQESLCGRHGSKATASSWQEARTLPKTFITELKNQYLKS